LFTNSRDHEARTKFVNWYCEGVCVGEIYRHLILFSDEAWFHLGGHLNSQNTRYWSAESPILMYETSLCDVRAGVWCVLCVHRITETFSET
jgi:hypothetical protein